MGQKQTRLDTAADIEEAGPDKCFSVKLLGHKEKFFVTARRMAEYVEQLKPTEWRDDMQALRAFEEGKKGYRLPVQEETFRSKKLAKKNAVTFESRKAKNIKARENYESGQ